LWFIWYLLNLKKPLAFLILLVILFNSIGYYLLFEVRKYVVKKEIQTAIQHHSSKMVILKIDHPEKDREFQWIDKKEFRYKGAMYDIVREKTTGHTTVFVCIHDVKETGLYAGLKRETKNKDHLALWDHHVMIFLSIPAIELNITQCSELMFPKLEISFNSPTLGTWSPPPELT